MNFDALDYLGFARKLVNNEQSEVCLRTAIGRGYYAVFLLARDKTGVMDQHHVHKVVEKAIKKEGHKATAQKFRALFRLRCVADYEIVPKNPSDNDWMENWQRAESIITNILPRIQSL